MKRTIKSKSTLYSYLNNSKVLETGTDEDIARVKKEYWREYKKEWRKQRNERAFTIYLNLKDYKHIQNEAKKHNRSPSKYIKVAALAYTNAAFVVPDIVAINTIREQLLLTHTAIVKLLDANKISFQVSKELTTRIADLEQKVLAALECPPPVKPDGL